VADPETVYILLVQTGRVAGDGLPEAATGAALVCYASGRTEKHAVDETVKVLREAGMAPLDVTSYGTREAPELELGDDERALMARALAENAVIVAQLTLLEDDDD
jgi:ABC-type hemin transport system ATPase subunit